MSEYRREKVLRVPIKKYIPDVDYDEFESKHRDIMGYKPGYFDIKMNALSIMILLD